MALLKVLLLLGLSVAVSSVSLQKRIIGGYNCRDDERHYHVRVFATDQKLQAFCGGSLISDQWVLTAAHCWKSDPGWVTDVHLGLHPKSAPRLIHRITQPNIYRDSNGRKHDIMLLKLPVKITTIRPIRLPDCPDTLLLGTKVQFAGFGPSQVGPLNIRIDVYLDDLQCAEFKIGKHEKLEEILAKFPGSTRRYQQWYSVESNKKDSSKGDSGGGLVFKNRLYGINSFSGDPLYALNKPSGFMDVCAYKQWIDETIN